MKKLLVPFLCLSMAGCFTAGLDTQPDVPLGAPWQMPSRQVTVRGTNITTLGQTIDSYAPTNTLQAYLEWMDDNWSGAFDTNTSYYYLDNTTQNMWRAIVRDYLTVDNSATIATNLYVGNSLYVSNDVEIIDDLLVGDDLTVVGDGTFSNNVTILGDLGVSNDVDVAGDMTVAGSFSAGTFSPDTLLTTNGDMAVSFMGYPKLALTTNNLDRTIFSISGTLIATNSFTNAFDADMSTATASGIINSDCEQGYEIDLGAAYNGFVCMKAGGTNSANIAYSVSLGDSLDALDADGGKWEMKGGTSRTSGYSGADFIGYWIQPFSGRYIYINAANGNTGSGNFRIFDISVYGVTNAYRNLGGF